MLVQILVEGLLGSLKVVVAGQDLLDIAHGARPLEGCGAQKLLNPDNCSVTSLRCACRVRR
jgi:hypothetical protein